MEQMEQTSAINFPPSDWQPRTFSSDIVRFNQMYGMGRHVTDDETKLEAVRLRLEQVRKMLLDEVREVDDIIQKLENTIDKKSGEPAYAREADLLTEIADWLGDIQVYCASEMERFNIPLYATLGIIMDSNFSKLNEDGTATFKDGKLQKGPKYWKPEPRIREMLVEHLAAQRD